MASPTGFYKVLGEGGKPSLGTGKWTVGKKRTVRGPLCMCINGLHVTDRDHLVEFLSYGPCIHPVIDASKERIVGYDKTVLRHATIGEAFPTWNERTQRMFAADCASYAVRQCRKSGIIVDKRVTECIRVVYRYANGEATPDELRAAWSAARSAAWSAAESAAWSAAESAAWSAARSAAWSAARSAAWSAAESAARKWQTKRLFEYLDGKRG